MLLLIIQQFNAYSRCRTVSTVYFEQVGIGVVRDARKLHFYVADLLTTGCQNNRKWLCGPGGANAKEILGVICL
ncbi:hypothetical protein AD47_4279 [Escherichia coli 6-319-05_S4_C3]|nr:hypothetical protein AD47_4279 [Escherichia coli 6-319-05_S4_C3]